jgi:hypothetical protein
LQGIDKRAYDDFYPLNIEPWEPNLTTMVNFESKWKKMISKGEYNVNDYNSR